MVIGRISQAFDRAILFDLDVDGVAGTGFREVERLAIWLELGAAFFGELEEGLSGFGGGGVGVGVGDVGGGRDVCGCAGLGATLTACHIFNPKRSAWVEDNLLQRLRFEAVNYSSDR